MRAKRTIPGILVLAATAWAVPAPPPGFVTVASPQAAAPAQVSGAQPRLRNAQLTTRAVSQGLDREFRALLAAQQTPAWVGYAVPTANENSTVCCGHWSNGSYAGGCCNIESDSGMNMTNSRDGKDELKPVVALEPALFVFFRVAERQVTTVRVFSADCELDAGGLAVTWLTGVRPEESIALLDTYVRAATDWSDRNDRSVAKRALTAIAMHAGAAADRQLDQYAAPNQPEDLRREVAFWLGEARGRSGYLVLRRMVKDDPSEKVRDKAIFGLNVSDEPEAVDTMINVAKNDPSRKVRGQALFWLGQKAGRKAIAALNDAIENDPDTEIKKKAVFGLSQLPKDEGVPLLIQVARTNRNPAVRKQAMFWLGQTGDPRALAFFEEILK